MTFSVLASGCGGYVCEISGRILPIFGGSRETREFAGLSDRKPAKAENISGPCTTLFQNDAC